MNNITKIKDGFIYNNIEYKFQSYIIEGQETEVQYEILSETQYQVGTDNGIIFFDVSITIDNLSFQTSLEYINYLFS
jgi:hypothetical protein